MHRSRRENGFVLCVSLDKTITSVYLQHSGEIHNVEDVCESSHESEMGDEDENGSQIEVSVKT